MVHNPLNEKYKRHLPTHMFNVKLPPSLFTGLKIAATDTGEAMAVIARRAIRRELELIRLENVAAQHAVAEARKDA